MCVCNCFACLLASGCLFNTCVFAMPVYFCRYLGVFVGILVCLLVSGCVCWCVGVFVGILVCLLVCGCVCWCLCD